jgi:hypothetical protein
LPLHHLRDEAAAITRVARPLFEAAGTGRVDPALGEQEAEALQRRMQGLAAHAPPEVRPQLEHAAWVLGMLRETNSRRVANRRRSRRMRKVRSGRRVRPLVRTRGHRQPGRAHARARRRARGAASCRDPDDPADGHPHVPLAGAAPWHWRREGWRP